MAEHPYMGIGKPEAIKYELAGYWSRRFNTEHRIVYRVIDDMIEIDVLATRYHHRKRQISKENGSNVSRR